MAGMLPGVESARRRRCHGTSAGWADSQSSSIFESSNSSRRSSLCLYSTNHSSHFNLLQKRTVNKYQQQQEHEEDEKLGGAAREAKERLDERLRSQYRKLEPKSSKSHSYRPPSFPTKFQLIGKLTQRLSQTGSFFKILLFVLVDSKS
ncbi:hypothetical protein DCAR_0415901 [Daucus carota subsp. sativus]|uniref:Uncharacterized protein n=1 Tax=Daucus carota subsp. sativus TaxID=79200 RepID=A0A165WW48_DAUCS|nr:hypothetical protein DCAR_0415901 [Daucus carota subsp. sativus]